MNVKWYLLRTYLLILASGIIFGFSFDFVSDLMVKQQLGDHSEVILAAIYGAKTSPRILNQTGDIYSEEYNLNTPSSTQDSLVLRIKLEGEKATAAIEAHAARQSQAFGKSIRATPFLPNSLRAQYISTVSQRSVRDASTALSITVLAY